MASLVYTPQDPKSILIVIVYNVTQVLTLYNNWQPEYQWMSGCVGAGHKVLQVETHFLPDQQSYVIRMHIVGTQGNCYHLQTGFCTPIELIHTISLPKFLTCGVSTINKFTVYMGNGISNYPFAADLKSWYLYICHNCNNISGAFIVLTTTGVF